MTYNAISLKQVATVKNKTNTEQKSIYWNWYCCGKINNNVKIQTDQMIYKTSFTLGQLIVQNQQILSQFIKIVFLRLISHKFTKLQ